VTKAQTIIKRKKWLAQWARGAGVDLSGYKAALPIMGPAARRVLSDFQQSVGLFPTGRWNGETLAWLKSLSEPTIVAHTWKPASTYGKRAGKPPGIVFHHAAASVASPDDINRGHIARGMNGIGYHFYVRKDGSIHMGRPEWATGAHCLGYNAWLGICAEGNYQTDTMPKAQLESLRWLRRYLHAKYPALKDRRHSDLNSTACPGSRYPWRKVIG